MGESSGVGLLDLKQLEILRVVAETGSFTSAGHKLHLSQSAVSRQILVLEAELEEQLFLRVAGKIRITPTGTTLLALSRRLHEDIDRTRAGLVESRKTLGGALRLVGGMTVCLYVFPALLKEFARAHPGVEVKMTPGATPRLVRSLLAGQADLGLLTLPVSDPALEAEPVMREELLVVTSPQHPLARKKKILPRELANQKFVLFEAGSSSRRTIEDFFLREQIAPKVVTETENVEIIKALVRVRLGITIIPYSSVAREVRMGQLFCARIAGHQLFRETGWVHLRSDHLPRAVQEMKRALDLVRPKLKLHPAED
jgi:DNA-binding transcriptional LysR family regulator